MDGGHFECNLVLPQSIKACSRQPLCVKGKCPVMETAAPMMRNSKSARVDIEFHATSKVRSLSERRYIDHMRNLEVN